MTDHYATGDSIEGPFQPGSKGTVLINKLGIIDPGEMNEIVLDLLVQLTDAGLDDLEPMKALFRQVLHETQQNASG